MRKIKEILHLRFDCKLTIRQISASIRVSTGAVTKYLNLFEQSGLKWPLPADVDDMALMIFQMTDGKLKLLQMPGALKTCKEFLVRLLKPVWRNRVNHLPHPGVAGNPAISDIKQGSRLWTRMGSARSLSKRSMEGIFICIMAKADLAKLPKGMPF